MWNRIDVTTKATAILIVSLSAHAALGQVLISSFENDLSSSVGATWEGAGVTPPQFVTTGATEGSSALAISHPGGWTIQAILKGGMPLAQAVAQHDFLLMDVTTTDLGIAGDGWSPSWRQVFITMNSSVGGWQQMQFDVPVAGDDGGFFTYNLIIDLNSEYDATGNPGKTFKSNAQEYVATNGGATPYFELFMPMQGGDQGASIKAGDYNSDNIVNAADYVVWRNILTSGGTLPNETVSIGTVDAADYDEWRGHFGTDYSLITTIFDNIRFANPGAGAGGLSPAAVPEPSLFLLAVVAAMPFVCKRRSRS